MSVVVRGMEMPENCIACPMQFGGWCYVAPPDIDERVAPTVDEAAEQGKPKWCPLVEVPESKIAEQEELFSEITEHDVPAPIIVSRNDQEGE